MLWPLLISTSTVKVLKYYVVLEYSSTLYLYRSRDPFPDRTLSRTAYTYYSCSRYLPYSFKKFLCVPGSQQENVPEHLNEPRLGVFHPKVSQLPKWRAPNRATKLLYLAHRGVSETWVWMGVLRGPVKLVISSTGAEVPI